MIPLARDSNYTYIPARLFVMVWAYVALFDLLALVSALTIGVIAVWTDMDYGPVMDTWGLVALIPAVVVTAAASFGSIQFRPDTHNDYPGKEPLLGPNERLFERRDNGWSAEA